MKKLISTTIISLFLISFLACRSDLNSTKESSSKPTSALTTINEQATISEDVGMSRNEQLDDPVNLEDLEELTSELAIFEIIDVQDPNELK